MTIGYPTDRKTRYEYRDALLGGKWDARLVTSGKPYTIKNARKIFYKAAHR